MTWSGSCYARIGTDVIEAVAGGIVLGGMRFVRDGQLQLAVKGIEQILVGRLKASSRFWSAQRWAM